MTAYTTKLVFLALALQGLAAVCGDGQADRMCRGCTDQNTCALCTYGFVNSTGLCQKSSSISHCLTYASYGICSVCDYGYYVTNNGTACSSIPLSGCARLNDNTTVSCLYCNNNILVDTNGTCNNNKCQTANCKYCTRNAAGNEICDRCNDNYVNSIALTGTATCISESSNTDNCYYASNNATNSTIYCILCDVDHYLSNGTCKSSGISNNNNDNGSSAGSLSVALVGLVLALFA